MRVHPSAERGVGDHVAPVDEIALGGVVEVGQAGLDGAGPVRAARSESERIAEVVVGQALELRDQLNRGEILGPQMVVTGAVLDGDPPFVPDVSLALSTPEDGRVAVRQQADAGVDMIKVYTLLEADTFLAIVDEAQQLGLKAVGHVPESIYIEAAAAGLASSEHLHGFDKVIGKLLGEPIDLTYRGIGADAGYLLRLDEVNRQELQVVFGRLGDSGLTVCPTVVTFRAGANLDSVRAGDFPGSDYISQSVLDIWETQWSQQDQLPDAMWQNWAQMVNQLNEAGVPLMVGTDLIIPGIIPGFSVHEEMAIWQDAGIAPAEVLRSATIVPTRFMGLDDRLGTIAEGKTASMVLVAANPLEDIRHAQQTEGVFLRGQYFSPDELDDLLAEAKDMAQSSTQ
ncbi:MAG: amidohydrolase family protein [Actinomycetia bacterium]|nr:amidohydrolase family protein [Actinomycetes bacterium]